MAIPAASKPWATQTTPVFERGRTLSTISQTGAVAVRRLSSEGMKTHTRPTVLDASTLPERLNTLLAERWPIFRDRIVASEIYGLSIPATQLLKPGAAEERLAPSVRAIRAGTRRLWLLFGLTGTW